MGCYHPSGNDGLPNAQTYQLARPPNRKTAAISTDAAEIRKAMVPKSGRSVAELNLKVSTEKCREQFACLHA